MSVLAKKMDDLLQEVRLIREQSKPVREIMNYDQAADYLGIAPSTLSDWVALRKVPFYKVGGSIRFKRSRLDKWIDRQEVATRL